MNPSYSIGSDLHSHRESIKLSIRASEKPRVSEFNLEDFLNNLGLQTLIDLDDQNLLVQLRDVDPVDLFSAVQELTRELTIVKLENHFITDFLEKNDAKLLIGLKQRRLTASSQRRSVASSVGRSTPGDATTRMSSRPSIMTTQSAFTTSSAMPNMARKATDYRLNFRAKAEMAEKTAADVEKRIAECEAKAMYKIKMLSTKIEELHYTFTETRDTAKNFELHFLKDEKDLRFLESGTERQLERKLRKFVNNWLKNGRALLGTMRLRITSLQETCHQYRSDLMSKSEMSGMLRAVDFERLVIKRDELLNALEEKHNHLNGLKGVTGKASSAMAEEKKLMGTIEIESKRIMHKTADVLRAIEKLEHEIKYVEHENSKDLKVLLHLENQIDKYVAPSVNEYIECKSDLLALEKEEKMLQRKLNIANMKLTNALIRYKRRHDGSIFESLV